MLKGNARKFHCFQWRLRLQFFSSRLKCNSFFSNYTTKVAVFVMLFAKKKKKEKYYWCYRGKKTKKYIYFLKLLSMTCNAVAATLVCRGQFALPPDNQSFIWKIAQTVQLFKIFSISHNFYKVLKILIYSS